MMETAKVDIRKLQQLNDRINQCLDALDQVRTSVHGLSHASAQNPYANPVGTWPQQAVGPYGFPAVAPQGFGLSHSSFGQPIGGYPPGFAGLQGQQGIGPLQALSGQPPTGFGAQQGIQPFGWAPTGGLSHSTQGMDPSRPVVGDPFLASRIAQTFPFAQQQVPPLTSIP